MVTNVIKKKFQSVVHHHKKVVISAQHHRLTPGDVLDGIINHVVQVAKKKNLVRFLKFASDLFQIEVYHLYTPDTNEFTLILHIPMVSNANLLTFYCHSQFISTLPPTFRSPRTSDRQTSSQLDTPNCFKQFPATCLHLRVPFFCKGRKVMDTSLKRSCLGTLYMANSHSIQTHCRFKIAEAREKIFKLSE